VDAIEWVKSEFSFRDCDSVSFVYDYMESQSGRSLAGIYRPFDPSRRSDWQDCGSVLDYLYASGAEGARVLDFGPGDGWPSLRLAPFVSEVVGVDGSARRVSVCRDNAVRLGIGNAAFVHVPPGEPLPFPDASFDAVVAASSVEQTPDPRATLRELGRVLRPGGRLRMDYESLLGYQGGLERDLWLTGTAEGGSLLVLFDRDVAGEVATQYGLVLDWPPAQVREALGDGADAYAALRPEALDALRPRIVEVRRCVTRHPSGRTLAGWLREAGFGVVRGTHSGNRFAGRLFDLMAATARPADEGALRELLAPLIQVVVDLDAPLETDPRLLAIKA
jgi:SAM-dependent methyltransferase